MVTDLVRDHVCLGKLATPASNVAATETSLEVPEKGRVKIYLAIEWTIKWSHGRLGKPTSRLGGSGKHDERWWLVFSAVLCKYIFPLSFCASQHSRYELASLIGCAWRLWIARCRWRRLLRSPET